MSRKQITTKVSNTVRTFLEGYEKATRSAAVEDISTFYAESFLFGGPQGTQAVKKEDFFKALPKRQGFFSAIGLKSTELVSFEETKLDDNYTMVRARWRMHYENNATGPIADDGSATYILFSGGHSLQIVMQIDHQDLMKRVQELGLM